MVSLEFVRFIIYRPNVQVGVNGKGVSRRKMSPPSISALVLPSHLPRFTPGTQPVVLPTTSTRTWKSVMIIRMGHPVYNNLMRDLSFVDLLTWPTGLRHWWWQQVTLVPEVKCSASWSSWQTYWAINLVISLPSWQSWKDLPYHRYCFSLLLVVLVTLLFLGQQ